MAKAKSKPRTTPRGADKQPRKPPAPVADPARAKDGEPAYLLALTEARLLVARDRAAKRRRQLAAAHGSAKRSKHRRQLSKATSRAAALEAHLVDLVAADPRLRSLSTSAQPTTGSPARAARARAAAAKPAARAARPRAAAAKPAARAARPRAAAAKPVATAKKASGAAKPPTKPAAGPTKATSRKPATAVKPAAAAKPAAGATKAAGAAKPAAGPVASRPKPRATAARRSPRAGGNAGRAHEP